MDPKYAPAWSDLARTIILLSDKQYGETPFIEAKAESLAALDRAFNLSPNLATALATQGFILINEGEQMEALSSFHQAIASDPNDGYAHFMISEVMAESANFSKALKALETAYELDNRHPIIQYRLVQYYLAKQNLTGLKRIIRPDQTLLLEALVDFRSGLEADGLKKAEKYLTLEEAGFAGVHLRMELARRYYYRLANLSMAQKAISESSAFAGRIYFQAIDYPEVAYQILRQIPDGYHSRFSKSLLARGQIRSGRFESCLSSLGYESVEKTLIRGSLYLGLPGSDLTLAYFQAFCLSKLNRVEEAAALHAELLRYHELAIARGEPPGYFRHLARLEMLVGNHDNALSLLEQAFENVALDWTDLDNPWYDEIRGTARFSALQQALYNHMNEQRQLLGWQPVPQPSQ